jgi:hypothetical protein
MELSDSQKKIFGNNARVFASASKRIQAFHFSLNKEKQLLNGVAASLLTGRVALLWLS